MFDVKHLFTFVVGDVVYMHISLGGHFILYLLQDKAF